MCDGIYVYASRSVKGSSDLQSSCLPACPEPACRSPLQSFFFHGAPACLQTSDGQLLATHPDDLAAALEAAAGSAAGGLTAAGSSAGGVAAAGSSAGGWQQRWRQQLVAPQVGGRQLLPLNKTAAARGHAAACITAGEPGCSMCTPSVHATALPPAFLHHHAAAVGLRSRMRSMTLAELRAAGADEDQFPTADALIKARCLAVPQCAAGLLHCKCGTVAYQALDGLCLSCAITALVSLRGAGVVTCRNSMLKCACLPRRCLRGCWLIAG